MIKLIISTIICLEAKKQQMIDWCCLHQMYVLWSYQYQKKVSGSEPHVNVNIQVGLKHSELAALFLYQMKNFTCKKTCLNKNLKLAGKNIFDSSNLYLFVFKIMLYVRLVVFFFKKKKKNLYVHTKEENN